MQMRPCRPRGLVAKMDWGHFEAQERSRKTTPGYGVGRGSQVNGERPLWRGQEDGRTGVGGLERSPGIESTGSGGHLAQVEAVRGREESRCQEVWQVAGGGGIPHEGVFVGEGH